jgi:outer membrane lipoprotein carrier protein
LKFHTAFCAAAFVVLYSVPALSKAYPQPSDPRNIQNVIRIVEARYHSSKTLKAMFLERYTEGRLTARVESGTAYFSRPGRMRWEYESPEEKLFLADGKMAWFYVPADHTVTRAPMKESNDWRTPLSLLTGKTNLARFCKHIELAPTPSGSASDVTLRCLVAGAPDRGGAADNGQGQSDQSEALVPGEAGQIRDVLLEVDPETGWLTSVTIEQVGGVEMQFQFGRWEANVALPETMFRFLPPKGVAIVDESVQPR